MVQAQSLTQGWEEIKNQKAELWIYLQDADQQLQNMKRRHAELEIKIAQNMVLQVKVGNDARTGSGVRSQGSGRSPRQSKRCNALSMFTSVCPGLCESLVTGAAA